MDWALTRNQLIYLHVHTNVHVESQEPPVACGEEAECLVLFDLLVSGYIPSHFGTAPNSCQQVLFLGKNVP